MGGYATVAPKLPDANGELTIANTEMLPYACVGVACAGLLYLVLATIIKIIGINKVMRFFPAGCNRPHHCGYRFGPGTHRYFQLQK